MQTTKSKIDKLGYQYLQKKMLGKGTFGTVYFCQRVGQIAPNPFNQFFYDKQLSESKYCAIKSYHQKLENNEGIDFSILRQFNLMLTADHPNIVAAHQVFFNRQKIQLVMDFHLQLSEIVHIQKIMKDQQSKKNACYQVTKGLAYLHQNYIMHRDLKPTNIFVSKQGLIKIGDFGMCKQFGIPKQKLTPYVCTRQYRAPELFLLTNYYTHKADIWSLGCVYYYIFTGHHLFQTESNTQLAIITNIFAVAGTPNQSNWVGYKNLPKTYQFQPYQKKNLAKQRSIPEQIAKLIQDCINLDPKKRPSASQLLQNPYFKEFRSSIGELEGLKVAQFYDQKIQNILNLRA